MKKKISLIMTAALICASFTGCGSNSSTPEQSSSVSEANSAEGTDVASKAKALSDSLDFTIGDKTVEKTSISDLSILGIDPNDVTEFSAYMVGSGATPDRFGIFNAKDAAAAKRVEDALKKHVEQQRKVFIDNDYTPAEKYKFDDSFVQTNGTVVSYAICADNSKAKELLK